MKFKVLGAIVASLALIAAAGVGLTWQTVGSVAALNDAVQLACDQGQTYGVVEVYPTSIPGPTPTPVPTTSPRPTAGPTSTPHAFAGHITIETATNAVVTSGESPGPYGSPLNAVPANSSTYTATLTSYPAKIYVTLAGDQWIEAVLSSPDPSGASNQVTITCTGAER